MILPSLPCFPLISCLRTQSCKLYAHLPPPPAVVERLMIDERVSASPNLAIDGSAWSALVNFFTEPSVARAGVLYYLVGIVFLTLWDHIVIPWLQDREIISVDKVLGSIRPSDALTHRERGLPWVTVLTADKAVPLPTREDMESTPTRLFFVGAIDSVAQFITLTEPTNDEEVKGVYEYSEEWSRHFRIPNIYIVKKRRW